MQSACDGSLITRSQTGFESHTLHHTLRPVMSQDIGDSRTHDLGPGGASGHFSVMLAQTLWWSEIDVGTTCAQLAVKAAARTKV